MFNSIIHLLSKYSSFFKNELNKSVIGNIDTKNFSVHLHTKGSKNFTTYKLSDVIYDKALISSLTPKEASTLGYQYGLNFKSLEQIGKNYNLTLYNSKSSLYNLLSIDRNKNIIFSYNVGLNILNKQMSPEAIYRSDTILKGFHPIQACYIGLLAGMNCALYKNII